MHSITPFAYETILVHESLWFNKNNPERNALRLLKNYLPLFLKDCLLK